MAVVILGDQLSIFYDLGKRKGKLTHQSKSCEII